MPAPRDGITPAAPLLVMRGIRKRYGATVALNGVDFDVQAGEIHALLGENGAGKSTLMQILAGLTRPDDGTIALNGTVSPVPSPHAARALGIAMVHQHFTLVPAFTVAENLALDRPQSGFGNYNPLQAASPALERAASLGWHFKASARAADLSVGAQQRVEIVKALATNARLLIFDEPTAVLAGSEVEELFSVLRLLRDEGNAVILIAHKLAEILAVADRVTVLRRGSRVASAPVSETNAAQLAAWMVGEEDRRQKIEDSRQQAAGSTENSGAAAFTAEGLTVRGDRGETVLNGVSLAVRRGEILGIGGVDGNGQTELAEALTGLRKLQSGKLAWNGGAFVPGTAPTTGYIPQDRRRSGLAVTMSIRDNLLFDAVRERQYWLGGFLKRRALRTLAQDLITQFDIRTGDATLPVSSLSGGNQQKIVAARAFYPQPDWIVAMNPTRGLDIGATRFVHDQLRAARNRGAAIVLISTDLDELNALANRAAILAGGWLTETALDGDAAELGLLLGGAGASKPV